MADTITTTIAIVSLLVPVAEGKATRYGPGVMDIVVENRLKWGQLDLSLPHAGYVALADRQYIGRRVIIEARGRLWGPYLVADCAGENHREQLAQSRFAVDLSYEVAGQIMTDLDAPLWGVRVYLVAEDLSGFDFIDGNTTDATNGGYQ